jgi:hypothetical protein
VCFGKDSVTAASGRTLNDTAKGNVSEPSAESRSLVQLQAAPLFHGTSFL